MGMISQVNAEECGSAVNKPWGYLSSVFNTESAFSPIVITGLGPCFHSLNSLLCSSVQPGAPPASFCPDPDAS